MSAQNTSAAKHTSGPWEAHDNVSPARTIQIRMVDGPEGHVIARVLPRGVRTEDVAERDANSRLIALSPRMLAFIQRASKHVALPQALDDEARAILRDVEGESNG